MRCHVHTGMPFFSSRLLQANSDANLGKFVPTEEDKKAIESTYQKNYVY